MEKPIEVLTESVTTIADREGKYLTFMLAGEEYGIEIAKGADTNYWYNTYLRTGQNNTTAIEQNTALPAGNAKVQNNHWSHVVIDMGGTGTKSIVQNFSQSQNSAIGFIGGSPGTPPDPEINTGGLLKWCDT